MRLCSLRNSRGLEIILRDDDNDDVISRVNAETLVLKLTSVTNPCRRRPHLLNCRIAVLRRCDLLLQTD